MRGELRSGQGPVCTFNLSHLVSVPSCYDICRKIPQKKWIQEWIQVKVGLIGTWYQGRRAQCDT